MRPTKPTPNSDSLRSCAVEHGDGISVIRGRTSRKHHRTQGSLASAADHNLWLPCHSLGPHISHSPVMQQPHHHHQQQQEQQRNSQGHQQPQCRAWWPGAVAGMLLALATLPGSAHAHIPTAMAQNPNSYTQTLPPEANMGIGRGSMRRADSQRDPPPVSTASRAKAAIEQLEAAHQAVREGKFDQALASYSTVVSNYGDLALAGYARTGRALMLYQVGRTTDALLELEDQEVALVGTAEVHAALAGILWVEKPQLAFRAEQQWEVAREFDSRYSDPNWVAEAKYWPPRALDALSSFLALKR